MLISAAKEAGIAVPPDHQVDYATYDRKEYPHWHVLCATQLGRAMDHGEHWENAAALAKIPADKLKTMTVNDLQAAGVNCGV
jgi:hypothetical protein